MLDQYHPRIAARCARVNTAVDYVGQDRYANWFGHWQIMTINFPKGKDSVKTKPHVDWKNPAVMFCAVTAFGEWSKQRCRLELGR